MRPGVFSILVSPIGDLLLTANERGLTGIHMMGASSESLVNPQDRRDDAALEPARRQLDEYFAGERTEFDLPLAPDGTAFQLRVWRELRRIPYGVTTSYGELARRIGNPNAMRAVGAANGRNPISIVVPCHRVIGADGTLTGFGGGLERKRFLLALESGQQSV